MEAVSGVRGVLELLDRTGKVEQRVVLDGAPVRIGRAYDNDLIIDDVHVSPRHAAVAESEGRLLLRDLGSVNGIRVAATSKRVDESVLDRECVFQLGTSQIRYRPLDHALTEAVPLHQQRLMARPFMLALIALSACLASFGFEASLASAEEFGGLKLLNAVLEPLLVILVWAGIWALVGRLLVHHPRYLLHVAVVSAGTLLGTLAENFLHLFSFALAIDQAAPWLKTASSCAMMTLILYGHLRLATRLRPRAALVGGLLFGLLIASASQIAQIVYHQQYTSQPRFALTLAPPSLRVRAAQTTDAFYAETQGLVDELRNEPERKPAPTP